MIRFFSFHERFERIILFKEKNQIVKVSVNGKEFCVGTRGIHVLFFLKKLAQK